MPSITDIAASYFRFPHRVTGKMFVGITNTGIDVVNLFKDTEDQLRPIDAQKDLWDTNVQRATSVVSQLAGEERAAQANAFLTTMTRAPESSLGEFTEDASVFLLGFLGARGAIQKAVGLTASQLATLKATKYGVDLAAGASSSFILEDPAAPRLANFIPEKHRPVFVDYLAYDPDADEARLEGRLKNALLDMGLGVVADGVISGILKTFKSTRRAIHTEAAGDPEKAVALANELGLGATPKVPKEAPDVPLFSEDLKPPPVAVKDPIPPKLEGLDSVTAQKLKSLPTRERVAEITNTYLKMSAEATDPEESAALFVKSLNHTWFDFTNPDQTVDLANTILKTVDAHLDLSKPQSFGDILEATKELKDKAQIKSFESLAATIGTTVDNLKRATPTVHLIRQMYAESANQLNKVKELYHTGDKATQNKVRNELRKRLETHLVLTTGLKDLGTGAGRLLSSFRMHAKGDLGAFDGDFAFRQARERGIKETTKEGAKRGAKEGAKRGAKEASEGALKNIEEAPVKDVEAELEKKVEALQAQLDELRGRFGDEDAIPPTKDKAPEDPEIKDLKDRIKFYKAAEADVKRIKKLEGTLEALQNLSTRGTKLDLEAGLKRLNLPNKPVGPEIRKLQNEIADIRKDMKSRLDAMEAPSLEERIAQALRDGSPKALNRALKTAEDVEFDAFMKTIKGLDMNDAKAWISGRETGEPPLMRALETLRKIKMMNILMGVPTFVANNMGNSLTLALKRGFEDIIASTIPVAGADRMTLMAELKSMRTVAEQPVRILGDLFKAAADSFKSGKKISETFAELAIDDISRLQQEQIAIGALVNSNAPWARIVNTYGKVAHAMSFGHMAVTDAVYKQSAFVGEVTSLANAKGIFRGLDGDALVTYVDRMVSQSTYLARKGQKGALDIIETMESQGYSTEAAVRHVEELAGFVEGGRKEALESTFQADITIQFLKDIEKAINGRNPVAHLFKTLIIPFYRTPVKIIEFAADRTPILNLLASKNRADLLGYNGARAKQRVLARMITGTTMYSAAFTLAQNNMITGSHRKEERAALLAAGIPEYSIRIPHTDSWIQYSRADPFALFLGVTADMNKLVEEGKLDAGTAVAATMNALSANVLHKTFMKGLSDALAAAENPQAFGAYFTESQVRAIVSPMNSFQRSFEKVWNANSEEYRKQKPDPALTELRGWVDILFGDSGLTDTRPYDMRDALGNPVKRNNLWSDLLGMKMTVSEDSPGLRELALLKRFPSNRELQLETGFKMSSEEFQEFKAILGSPDVRMRERLDRLVQSRDYRRAPLDSKVRMIDKTIRDARSVAKALLIKRDPELRSSLMEFKKERLRKTLESMDRYSSGRVPELSEILSTRRTNLDRDSIL